MGKHSIDSASTSHFEQPVSGFSYRTFTPDKETQEVSGEVYRMLADSVINKPTELFAQMVQRYFNESANLLLKKHKDYGAKNISLAPGGALNGLRVRMWDKTARINNLIDSGATPENESLKDSFQDLANYAIIAMMVLDGKWPKE